MGNMKIKIILPFFIIILSSCEKMELRGFFTSYENVNERFEQSLEWNNLNAIPEINITPPPSNVSGIGGVIKFKNAFVWFGSVGGIFFTVTNGKGIQSVSFVTRSVLKLFMGIFSPNFYKPVLPKNHNLQ